jgi:hypothetical protein
VNINSIHNINSAQLFFSLENHPCVTNPASVCLNGGVCTINGADYLCNCAAGWSGTNCQTQGGMLSLLYNRRHKVIAFFRSLKQQFCAIQIHVDYMALVFK